MSGIDPWSPEGRDPFHVPDRTREILWFAIFVVASAMLPFSFSLPPISAKWPSIISFALFVLIALSNCLQARSHRFARERTVEALRNRMDRCH